MANLICSCCGEEITSKDYALPFNNIDNACHLDCLEDWFENNLQNVINVTTTFYEED